MPEPFVLTLPVVGREHDLFAKADAEARFEQAMADYQEEDGSYSCDHHVILDLAIQAVVAAALTRKEPS